MRCVTVLVERGEERNDETEIRDKHYYQHNLLCQLESRRFLYTLHSSYISLNTRRRVEEKREWGRGERYCNGSSRNIRDAISSFLSFSSVNSKARRILNRVRCRTVYAFSCAAVFFFCLRYHHFITTYFTVYHYTNRVRTKRRDVQLTRVPRNNWIEDDYFFQVLFIASGEKNGINTNRANILCSFDHYWRNFFSYNL